MVRPDPEFDVLIGVKLAFVVQRLIVQALKKHRQGLVEPGPPFFRIDSEPGDLVGDDAPAHAQFQAAVAQVVQHADLLDQAQRVV